MKKIKAAIVGISLAFSPIVLSACTPLLDGVANPSTAANLTKRDEQAVNTAELAYKGFRLTVETGVNAGLIKGQLAGKLRELDNQLYSKLVLVETAYNAANATSLTAAIADFNVILGNANAVVADANAGGR